MTQIDQEILQGTMTNITHHSDKNCFILTLEKSLGTKNPTGEENAEAILEYRLLPNQAIDFTRTYVPNEFRGKGLAEKLVRQGLAWAKQQELTIQASCWYVDKFLR